MIYYSIATYVFRSLSRSHIAREMLTYCHAPAHSCSRLIPCEDRALTIRGFSALHRAQRDVKYFHSMEYSPSNNRPLPNPPTRGGSSYNRLVPHQQNIILPSLVEGQGEGPLGSLGWGRRGWINSVHHFYILHFISLQITVSHHKSL